MPDRPQASATGQPGQGDAGVIAHRAANAVAGASGYVELLREGRRGPLTATQQDALARIARSLATAHARLRELIGLVSGEQGTASAVPGPGDGT